MVVRKATLLVLASSGLVALGALALSFDVSELTVLVPNCGRAKVPGRTPAPPRAGTGGIVGLVMDGWERPVAGSRLWTHDPVTGCKVEVAGDSVGVFAMRGLPSAAGRVRLFATAPGHAISYQDVVLTERSPEARVRLRLWRGVSLRGRVTMNGGVRCGVRVVARLGYSAPFLRCSSSQAVTTRAGEFCLTKVPLGLVSVKVADPRLVGRQLVVVNRSRRFDLEVQRRAVPLQRLEIRRTAAAKRSLGSVPRRVTSRAEVRGRLMHKGRPLRFAMVALELSESLVRQRTDVRGWYHFRDVPSGIPLRVVFRGTEGLGRSDYFEVTEGQIAQPASFPIRPLVTLDGVLCSQDDRPLANTPVWLFGEDHDAHWPEGRCVTDAQGRFRFRGLRARSHLLKPATDYWSFESSKGQRVAARDPAEAELIILRVPGR